MRDAPQTALLPVLTVSQAVYDAVLLADGVQLVAEGDILPSSSPLLPAFYKMRRCRLNGVAPARPPRFCGALLARMVGG